MMNKGWIYLVVIALITACRGEVKKVLKQEEKPKNALQFMKHNIDTAIQTIDTIALSQSDTAYVLKNKPVEDDMGDKQKTYVIEIHFSKPTWPVLTYKNAIGADLFLTEDLDGDGGPELLLRPEWFSSCWASINLFSLKRGKWQLVKNGSMYFCSDQYPLSKRVIKTKKCYGLLTDSLANDKFITLKNELKF